MIQMRCLNRQLRQHGRTGGIVAAVDDIVMGTRPERPTTPPRPTEGQALVSGYDLRTALREVRRIGHVAPRGLTSPEGTVPEEPRPQPRLYCMGRSRDRADAAGRSPMGSDAYWTLPRPDPRYAHVSRRSPGRKLHRSRRRSRQI